MLASRVDLATIDVTLTERTGMRVSDDLPGFATSLGLGWVTLVNVVKVGVVLVGFLLPFAPFALGGVWLLHRHLRRRRSVALVHEAHVDDA